MKRISLFSFIIKYFGFLKIVPFLPLVFDSLLKLWTLVARQELLDWFDEIEAEILSWEKTSVSLHEYSGLQGRISSHHVFENSGWISFYIDKYDDVIYAKELFGLAYLKSMNRDAH